MQAVIRLLSHVASKRNREITLLVLTTGVTGSAALQAISDVDNPLLTIFDFQRKQMTTVQSPCVGVAGFQGSDDNIGWHLM
jgi:threonine synthase